MIDIPLAIAEQTPAGRVRGEAARAVERLTDAQKDELWERTQKATPGTWTVGHNDARAILGPRDRDGDDLVIGIVSNSQRSLNFHTNGKHSVPTNATAKANAAFIAAANPQTVLALLSELKATGEELVDLKTEHRKLELLWKEACVAREDYKQRFEAADALWEGAYTRASKAEAGAEAAESQLSTLTEELAAERTARLSVEKNYARARQDVQVEKSKLGTLTAQMEKVRRVTGSLIGWVAGINDYLCKLGDEQSLKFIPLGQELIRRAADANAATPSNPSSLPEAGKEIG